MNKNFHMTTHLPPAGGAHFNRYVVCWKWRTMTMFLCESRTVPGKLFLGDELSNMHRTDINGAWSLAHHLVNHPELYTKGDPEMIREGEVIVLEPITMTFSQAPRSERYDDWVKEMDNHSPEMRKHLHLDDCPITFLR